MNSHNYWEDLLSSKTTSNKEVIVWACNCMNLNNRIKGTQNLAAFMETEVDKEGLCKRCKYYAVKMKKDQMFELVKREKLSR